MLRGHSLSTYVYSEKLTFLTPQGLRNVSFAGNIAYVLNGWPLKLVSHARIFYARTYEKKYTKKLT